MWSKDKKEFRFVITYFSIYGKLYDIEFDYKYSCRYNTRNYYPNMNDVAAHIRGLRNSGGQSVLPGDIDEGFEGYIVIKEHDNSGNQIMVLPPKDN